MITTKNRNIKCANIADINKRKADPKIPDRIDIHCEIQAVPFSELSQMEPGEPSEKIRERVIKARQIQTERISSLSLGEGGGRGSRIHCNAQMTEKMLHEYAEPDAASLDMLRMAMERLKNGGAGEFRSSYGTNYKERNAYLMELMYDIDSKIMDYIKQNGTHWFRH